MLDTPGITEILSAWQSGDQRAFEALMSQMQRELRRTASFLMAWERPSHTLQPSALVNELCLRLLSGREIECADSLHFRRLCASMMRRLLVDHARKHAAAKRSAGSPTLVFEEELFTPHEKGADILKLESALRELAKQDPRKAQIVELRFYGGLSVAETAAILEISTPTVKRDWRVAKGWLYTRLKSEE